jgi:hypothetical protein
MKAMALRQGRELKSPPSGLQSEGLVMWKTLRAHQLH